MEPTASLRILPLGGIGHIGGNLTVYETPNDLLVVDCGLLFPTEEQPGVDYVIPDIGYLRERLHKLRAIVLTHGHEDHLGAVPYLWPELGVPVFGTDFTLSLLAHKLGEFPEVTPELRRIRDGEWFTVGGLELLPIPVTHSIPGAVALAIRTPVGTVVHTGDFKLDEAPPDGRATDSAALRALGDRGVVALLSDSTNSEKPGRTYGEAVAADALRALIAETPHRVVVTAFASNIFRLQAIIDASVAAGRKVALAGRSIAQNVQMSLERGFMVAPAGTFVDLDDVCRLPRSRLTVIAGGSQGEPRSALSRIAAGQHGQVRLEPRDRVILSSRRIPGNERAVGAVVNNLCRLGAEVIDDRAAQVHASGHAFADEQRAMLEWCRPRFFVPVHGEYRQLVKHAALAEATGVPAERVLVIEDGQPIDLVEVSDGVAAMRAEPVHAGFVYVDGKRVGDVGEVVLRDRRVLSETGIVFCIAVFDESGRLAAGPLVSTRGVLHEDVSQEVLRRAEDEVRVALSALAAHADHETRVAEVRLALRRFCKRQLDARPLVVPVVMTI